MARVDFPKGKGNLKPAYEPILLCRKPGPKVLPLGIDACRVPCEGGSPSAARRESNRKQGPKCAHQGEYHRNGRESLVDRTSFEAKSAVDPSHALGRWPANVIIDDSAEVMAAFAVAGERKSGRLTAAQQINGGFKGTKNCYGTANHGGEGEYEANSGSAARFFYAAKASRKERNAGLEGMAESSQPDAHNLSSNACERCGLRIKANGSGNKCECGAARVTVQFPPSRNGHPCVKPLALMEYLVRLVTPPGGTVLDPFLGSGTTGVACVKYSFGFIGVEREAEYMEIARRRIAAARDELPLLAKEG